MQYLFVDTNIILSDVHNLFTIQANYPDHSIYLSEIVIEELDSKKSALGEIGYQAREFARLLARAEVTDSSPITKVPNTNGGTKPVNLRTITYSCDGIGITIISDLNRPDTCLTNDAKIVHTASLFDNSLLLSNDVMCRVRAEIAGVQVGDFKQVERVDFEFFKQIDLCSYDWNYLNLSNINQLDPDYCLSNFSYMFRSIETGETILTTVDDDKLLNLIDKPTEVELRKQVINPVNKEQLLLSSMIQDQHTDIVLCEAIAGSGKTLVSVSNAMKLLDENRKYHSIVYMRNTVNDSTGPDEEIGFLKGSKEEKTADLFSPMYTSLATLIKLESKTKLRGIELHNFIDEQTGQLVGKYDITCMSTLGLRGDTIDDAVIIIDEAQNFSKKTMQKSLSRIGKNCKVIIIGSLRQIDSNYVTKYTSGFSVLLDATNRTDLPITMKAVTLNKVVRGPITEFAELIFTTKEYNHV